MAANRLASGVDHCVVVVPLAPSVIEMFGCRPGTTIRLLSVDGQLQVLPNSIPTKDSKPAPSVSPMWESCRNWWKSRGSSTHIAGPPDACQTNASPQAGPCRPERR